MEQKKFNEYMRLDLNIKHLEDEIRHKGNKQFRLRNEILKLGHGKEQGQKKIEDLKRQQYGILGRAFIEDEDKGKNNLNG